MKREDSTSPSLKRWTTRPFRGIVLSAPAALRVHPAIPGDLDGDGDVDMPDFADFASMFGGPE